MTLGLSVSSRLVGMAVLEEDTLVEYRIQLFKEHWNPKKQSRILECIAHYIKEYKVTNVALLIPLRHYTNPETKTLLLNIPSLCKPRHVAFSVYTLKDLFVLFPHGRAKKRALMRALTLLYPELCLAQKRELSNKKHYYTKLFEAVGVATVHARKVRSQATQAK